MQNVGVGGGGQGQGVVGCSERDEGGRGKGEH